MIKQFCVFRSPGKAVQYLAGFLLMAVLPFLLTSCLDSPSPVAPQGVNDVVAQTDTDLFGTKVADITMPLVQRIAGGKGAIKEHFDPDRGWVNLNTTASGRLIATMHLQNGRPDTEFSLTVRLRYEDGSMEQFVNIATLTTNAQGKGNLQVQLDTNPSGDSTTIRRVAIRLRRPTPPNLLYLAVAWDVPLK